VYILRPQRALLFNLGVDEARALKKSRGYSMRNIETVQAVGNIFPADSTGLA